MAAVGEEDAPEWFPVLAVVGPGGHAAAAAVQN